MASSSRLCSRTFLKLLLISRPKAETSSGEPSSLEILHICCSSFSKSDFRCSLSDGQITRLSFVVEKQGGSISPSSKTCTAWWKDYMYVEHNFQPKQPQLPQRFKCNQNYMQLIFIKPTKFHLTKKVSGCKDKLPHPPNTLWWQISYYFLQCVLIPLSRWRSTLNVNSILSSLLPLCLKLPSGIPKRCLRCFLPPNFSLKPTFSNHWNLALEPNN